MGAVNFFQTRLKIALYSESLFSVHAGKITQVSKLSSQAGFLRPFLQKEMQLTTLRSRGGMEAVHFSLPLKSTFKLITVLVFRILQI